MRYLTFQKCQKHLLQFIVYGFAAYRFRMCKKMRFESKNKVCQWIFHSGSMWILTSDAPWWMYSYNSICYIFLQRLYFSWSSMKVFGWLYFKMPGTLGPCTQLIMLTTAAIIFILHWLSCSIFDIFNVCPWRIVFYFPRVDPNDTIY